MEVTYEGVPSLPERSVAELAALAGANSPELRSAQLERRAREDTLAGEENGRWPTVNLVGNYAVFSRFNNINTFYNRFQTNSLNVGIEARVPVFNAETGAQIALARSELALASLVVKRQQDALELAVRRAAGEAHELAASRDVTELELAIAQEHVRLTEARLAEGRADRLDREKTLVEEGRAWDAFYQAEFNREKAQLELRRVTGEVSRLFP